MAYIPTAAGPVEAMSEPMSGSKGDVVRVILPAAVVVLTPDECRAVGMGLFQAASDAEYPLDEGAWP